MSDTSLAYYWSQFAAASLTRLGVPTNQLGIEYAAKDADKMLEEFLKRFDWEPHPFNRWVKRDK